MSIYLWPIFFTIFAWWFGTGIILFLNQRSPTTYQSTFWLSGCVMLFAIVGIKTSSSMDTVAAAYCGFACALLVWAWQEIGFLLGFITGPRRIACPPEAKGWKKVGFAFQTIQHHEIALIVLAAVVTVASWGGVNQTAFWTFMILWIMRQSAKLNLFLGVLNLNENFLPSHLKYIHSYFSRSLMNPLLPVSVIAATVVVVPIWQAAFALGASPYQITSCTILGTLLSLAILEHILLVLPISSEGLWRWSFRA